MTLPPTWKAIAAGFTVILLAANVAAVRDCDSHPIPSLSIKEGFCAYNYGEFGGPVRGIDKAPNDDLLILVRTFQSSPATIKAVYETPGASEPTVVTLATMAGLNHAVKYKNGYVYASTDTTVYRWTYQGREPMTNQETVITNMPGGGHTTRTIEFGEKDDYIYVSVGSQMNIDPDSSRSRVVRARVNADAPLPYSYPSMEVFADGLRNEVGIRMDPFNRLWGVENGMDYLDRFDTDPPLYITNPAEEVNIFTQANAGRHYGYPWCWTEGIGERGRALSFPGGLGNGTIWATSGNDPVHDDEWCRAHTLPVAWAMQAHSAPLDIYFDNSTSLHSGPVAVIPLHGSWNRPNEWRAGFRVDFFKLDDDYAIQGLETLISFPIDDTWRPVAAMRGPCSSYGSCLFITDDYSSGKIIAIAEIAQSNPGTSHAPAVGGVPSFEPQLAAPHMGNEFPVTPQMSVRYSIRDGIITTDVVNTNATGWLGVGWKNTGNMAGSIVLLLNSTHTGFVDITDRTAAGILGTWNSPNVSWGYTDLSGAIEDGQQTLSFSRPLKCPEDAADTCVDIIADGAALTYFVYGYQFTQTGNVESATLALHSGRGALAVILNPPEPQEGPNEPMSAASHLEYKVILGLVLGIAFLLIH